jgi:hypothetical protein
VNHPSSAPRALAFAIFLCCYCKLLSAEEPFARGASQLDPKATSMEVSCSPEQPVAEIGSVIRVRVFASAGQEQIQSYAWKVSVGTIQGSGSEVQWNLTEAPSGFSKATVTVTNAGTKVGDCSMEVIVTEPERGAKLMLRETTRTFLSKVQKEEAGYGLYSYLLLGSPPTDASRVRYLMAIEAYLNLILPLDDLQETVDHKKLNITYLPLKTPVPARPTSQWLLDNYDFARARVLLDLIGGGYREGPYIISSLRPLSGTDALSTKYLFQDLSTVPTNPKDLVSWWIREFQNQAAQERFWTPQSVEILALRIRTTISVLATGLPEVQKQVATWVAWAK